MSDTWHPWIGPRVLLLLATQGHMSTSDSPTVHQSIRAMSSSYGLYGPATSDRTDCTDCTDRYSQHQTFCLFGLMNRSRYLLHIDSVWESKYTTGIRKTRGTQWHCFHRILSTLIFGLKFEPWSRFWSFIVTSKKRRFQITLDSTIWISIIGAI